MGGLDSSDLGGLRLLFWSVSVFMDSQKFVFMDSQEFVFMDSQEFVFMYSQEFAWE